MIELVRRLGYAPKQCVWELTLSCNMRCLHCGSFAGPPRREELSWPEMQALAHELADLGCEKITLGGGEPTLHPHWSDLAALLTGRGVQVILITNGWTWSPELQARAKAAGIRTVGFSLDGFEPDHDKIRKVGSFERVVSAIDACVAGGLSASVVSHVNRLNAGYLREMRDFLRSHGVAAWQLQLGNPAGAMGEHRELVIEPAELLWLVPLIAELRTEGGRPEICPGDNIGYFGACEKALRDRGAMVDVWIGCRAGCHVLGIESNGNIKGCLSLPSSRHGDDAFLEGNVRDSSLTEIWNRPGAFAFNREFTEERLDGFCGVCRYRDICRGGCSWTAWSHTQSRWHNPYCLYYQAVKNGRYDLLGEDRPNALEVETARTFVDA